MPPTDERACTGLQGLFPAIDHIALILRQVCQGPPVFEIVKVAGGECFAGFDLNRCDFFTIHQQTVNLFAVIILPKIGLAIVAAMKVALDELIDDQILKKRAFQVMQADLALRADAEQRTGDTRIVKIEFG